MNDRVRKNQTLPADFAALLRGMREDRDPRYCATLHVATLNGWTCQSLADALGVSRQAVDQAAARATFDASVHLPEVPLPPRKPQPDLRPPRRRLLVNDALAAELREMQQTAATVNGGTPADAPARKVSKDFTARLYALIEQGVSVKHLADVLGVHHNAVVSRLARHGYRQGPPSQAHVQYLGRPRGEKTHCKKGHALSGDNLYVIPKTGNRICRVCHKARHAAYRERKRQAGAA